MACSSSALGCDIRRLWQISLVSPSGSEVIVQVPPSMSLKSFRELAEESALCCDHDGAISLLFGLQDLAKLGEHMCLQKVGLTHQACVTVVIGAPEKQQHFPGERILQSSLHTACSSRTRVLKASCAGALLPHRASSINDISEAKTSQQYLKELMDRGKDCAIKREEAKEDMINMVHQVARQSAQRRFNDDLKVTKGKHKKVLKRIRRHRFRVRVYRETNALSNSAGKAAVRQRDPETFWALTARQRREEDGDMYEDPKPLSSRLVRTYSSNQRAYHRRCSTKAKSRNRPSGATRRAQKRTRSESYVAPSAKSMPKPSFVHPTPKCASRPTVSIRSHPTRQSPIGAGTRTGATPIGARPALPIGARRRVVRSSTSHVLYNAMQFGVQNPHNHLRLVIATASCH